MNSFFAILSIFCTAQCYAAATATLPIRKTQYGTCTLQMPKQAQSNDQKIIEKIKDATIEKFTGLSSTAQFNEKEQLIFDAHTGTNPKEDLLKLAAKARVEEWSPAYVTVIDAFIEFNKNQ